MLQRTHWNIDAAYVHHLRPETDTVRKTGPANSAGTVRIRTTFDTLETKTASGIPYPVRTTARSSTTAKAARQAITDSKEIIPIDWDTACMAEPETANPTNDRVDTHEMLEDQAGKRALNNYDLTQHPQNNALV